MFTGSSISHEVLQEKIHEGSMIHQFVFRFELYTHTFALVSPTLHVFACGCERNKSNNKSNCCPMLILCITLFKYAATTIRLCPFHPQDTLICNSFLTLGQPYQPSVNNMEGNCVGITIRVVKNNPGLKCCG